MFKKFLTLQLIVILVVVGYLVFQARQSENDSRASNGLMPASNTSMPYELKPCPDKPNCVNTMATDEEHKAEPIAYTGSQEEAHTKLLAVLDGTKRTTRATVKDDYIHYTFKTWPIPFVDDVEFLFDDANKVIHYRSASRVGHSDLGANARRMKKVVAGFKK